MARVQQTIVNQGKWPIYVSVEPWPECFELKPADTLTLVWDAEMGGDVAKFHFVNAQELVFEPSGALDQIQFLINGEPARHLSWAFNRA